MPPLPEIMALLRTLMSADEIKAAEKRAQEFRRDKHGNVHLLSRLLKSAAQLRDVGGLKAPGALAA